MAQSPFPRDFLWGVATSAFQIEGATNQGGRKPSIWDTLAQQPGRIAGGDDPSTACDHYRLWEADIERLKWLGVNSYRFSIAWPRVMPNGRGNVNPVGFEFYDRLIDTLLEAGISPFVTLYHWDLPQALQDTGGWGARDTVHAFVDYAAAVTSVLGDRVAHWVTHNEPWCIAHLGHEDGEHAPGHQDPGEALRAAHHILLSHGMATQVIRENVDGAEIGIVLNLTPATPATDLESDRDAARWFDGFFNRWYLDPLFRGSYPADAIVDRVKRGHLEAAELPFVQPGDLDAIAEKIDFLGINYYGRAIMRENIDGEPEGVQIVAPEELTDMGWEVYPQGLRELLVRVHQDYSPPKIYITENGVAYSDGPNESGRIEDKRRVDFHQSHLAAARRAIADGVPLSGYFAWSLLDNFEWAHGYKMRFGLYWVDYETQERIPKDSAHWYRDFIAGGGVESEPASTDSRRPS